MPLYFSGSETNRFAGRVVNSTGGTQISSSIYFDVIVSENALAVGIAAPRSKVTCDTGNGYGSTNTKIRRFANASTQGTAITYTDDAALGGSFKINEDGVYNISYADFSTTANDYIGLSKNTTQPTTSVASLTDSSFLILAGLPTANNFGVVPYTDIFRAGDVIRAHTSGTANGNNNLVRFVITKVSN